MVQIIRMCQAIFIVLLMLTVSSNGASIRKVSDFTQIFLTIFLVGKFDSMEK